MVLIINHSLALPLEELKITGTGDSEVLLNSLKTIFERKYPGVSILIPKSVGSSGGLRALNMGNTDLARTSRPLEGIELTGLVEFQFAKSPIVFAVHPSVENISELTEEQLIYIYSGKIRNWKELGGPDHKIYVVDRESNDSSRIVLENILPEFKNTEAVSKTYYNVKSTANAIADHSFTIGYLPISTARSHQLKILPIVDIASEEPEEYAHPLFVPLYIVSKGQPRGLAKQYIDYLYSEEAQTNMKQLGVVPVNKAGN